jgi:hypothetical protein
LPLGSVSKYDTPFRSVVLVVQGEEHVTRIRGEHDKFCGPWRPTCGHPEPQAAGSLQSVELEDPDERRLEPAPPDDERDLDGCHESERLAPARPRRAWRYLLLVTLGFVGVQGLHHAAPAARERLPASPGAWLDAYEAASIDNPPRVCSELFSPQLAAAYAHAAHSSCSSYFRRMTSSSVTVRRILQDGQTAVLELRQVVGHVDWDVVLDRQSDGWTAVDLLTGKLLR